MGIYGMRCHGCGKPFRWFSDNTHQLCESCIAAAENFTKNIDDMKTKIKVALELLEEWEAHGGHGEHFFFD
jgi:NMD protein affecting ribosome stability and mRNA decay